MEVTVKDVCLLKFGEVSKNGTLYTKNSVKKFLRDRKKAKVPLFGGLEQNVDTNNGCLRMCDISHEVSNLRICGNKLLGDIKILDTPMGRALNDALKGCDIGIALRGFGDVDDSGKVTNLNVLSFDICKEPSFDDAVILSSAYLKESGNGNKK